MKKYLLLFALVGIIGCTPAEKDKAADIIGKTTAVVDVVTDIAATAGVPFAVPVGTAFAFLSTTVLAILKRGSEKKKKEALYQSTADISTAIGSVVSGIKDKSISLEEVGKLLPGLVKDVSVNAHSAYGVYKDIEKDLNKLQAKGKVKKLS